MPAPTPFEIVEPFGVNAADPTSITLPIPVPSQIGITDGAASFNDGFPPLTMEPIIAGGVPPFGQDMNGILYTITSHLAALNGGQLYDYSATWSTATGGYDLGAVLTMADDTGLWFNLVNNNTSNPDTGGAGWVPLYCYGYTTLSGLTGGTVTLTSAQHKRAVIILQGVLATNLVLQFPTDKRQWLIINETTGVHTTTCKALGGSNSVTVPQGGLSAPVSIYGDGTDVWPTVAPLSVVSDIAATPLTLAERDSSGNLFAAYFNSGAGLTNPVIGAIFVQNSVADGYLQKISLANFQAQLFNNAALTGVPTAPTPAFGDSSTKIATTQFVQDAIATTLGTSGSVTLPGGLIFKWGQTASLPAISVTNHINFPVAFPTACYNVQLTPTSNGGTAQSHDGVNAITRTGFNIFNATSIPSTFNWFAIGT